MRTPEFEMRVGEHNVKTWMKKIEHSLRAMHDDEKRGHEWSIQNITNLQSDCYLLDKMLERYSTARVMRDADEKEWFDAPVAQSAEATDSKSV